MRRINEAMGSASEIEAVAMATAKGIREIATAISMPGGKEAVNLRVAEQYINEFGNLAKTNNTMIIPSNMADLAGLVATATKVISNTKANPV